MKAVVVAEFLDKYDNNIVYKVGDTVDFDDERIKDLTERKLVSAVEEPKKATTKRRK